METNLSPLQPEGRVSQGEPVDEIRKKLPDTGKKPESSM
jgi:hypothetical protein